MMRSEDLGQALRDAAGDVPPDADLERLYRRAANARRSWILARTGVAVVVVGGLVGGTAVIAGRTGDGARSRLGTVPAASSSPSPRAQADPASLLGRWSVAVAGAPAGQATFGDDLVVATSCGDVRGTWAADPEGVIAMWVNGAGCAPTGDGEVLGWVGATSAYVVGSGGDVRFLDGGGRTVAVLHRLSPPTGSGSASSVLPVATPLPSGAQPATNASLAGRWRGPGSSSVNGLLAVLPDGTWHTSDGCNTYGGRIVVGAQGDAVVASGGSTLIACKRGAIGMYFAATRRIAMDGRQRLVLYDRSGVRLGSLTRAS